MALFNDRALTLTTSEGPFRLTGISATPNLFELLGVAPAFGTSFDAAASDGRQIVLSHETWERHFARDRSVVGRSIAMDGEAYQVVGVMPADFGFPTPEAAFWVPLNLTPGGSRGMLLPAIARLRPDATLAGVLQEGSEKLGESGDRRATTTLSARSLQDQMVGGVQRVLWVLLAAVGFVLVIATANIALLLLTRGASREREFSIRLALGAGRGRLVRQLFIEGLTLGALGGVAGLGVAWTALELLVRLAPADIPRLREATIDGPVLAFAIAITGATSLIFGILSAGRTLSVDPIRAFAGSPGESRLVVSAGASRRWLNRLAAGELALTMVLLVGAGLLLRSFVTLVLVDQGFDSRQAVAFQVTLPSARYPSPAARMAFHERLLDRLQQERGVTHAGLATAMPNRQPTGRFDYSSTPLPDTRDPFATPTAEVRMVTEGFFEAMGLPLLAGRTFRSEDRTGAEPVIVISDALARQQFPNRQAVGELLYSRTGNRRVVGVVRDVRPVSADGVHSPAAYLPLRQAIDLLEWHAGMNAIVRGPDPRALATSLRSLVLSLDPSMPPFNLRTMDDEVSRLVAGPRFSATMLAAFAGMALVMAAVGVYGVMAYSAGLRTREIGIRTALGSTRTQVLRLMLRDGVRVVASGLVLGLVAAIWLARGLTGLLHEVTAADPLALAAVAIVLAATGLVAAYLPARRATRINALDALRHD